MSTTHERGHSGMRIDAEFTALGKNAGLITHPTTRS